MRPKATGIALGLMIALVGCSMTAPGLKDAAAIPRIGSAKNAGKDIVPPKQCALKIVIASRPEADNALGVAIWQVTDEQAISPEARRTLQANGLRAGKASGEMPPEVESMFNETSMKRPQVQTIVLPEGEPTLINPGTPETPALDLFLLNKSDQPIGKIYQDAHGFIRVVAEFEGKEGVSLRITPEVHHGPMRRDWTMANGATPQTPKQLVVKDGQQEESFRDLASTITLEPGQVAVLGARPERKGTLGAFLFNEPEVNSDRPLRKVIFIWASRSESSDMPTAPPAQLIPIDPATDDAKK